MPPNERFISGTMLQAAKLDGDAEEVAALRQATWALLCESWDPKIGKRLSTFGLQSTNY